MSDYYSALSASSQNDVYTVLFFCNIIWLWRRFLWIYNSFIKYFLSSRLPNCLAYFWQRYYCDKLDRKRASLIRLFAKKLLLVVVGGVVIVLVLLLLLLLLLMIVLLPLPHALFDFLLDRIACKSVILRLFALCYLCYSIYCFC